MTPDLLTPEELADYKERWSCNKSPWVCNHAQATHRITRSVGLQLIATLEAAWAENERLRKALAAKTARPQDQALS